MRRCLSLCVVCCLLVGPQAWAQIVVRDDSGRDIILERPARRVVTLSPHATELVFAAGGGKQIVATVIPSDYPPEARGLPRIGDGVTPDPERVAAYAPDLIIGWLPSQYEALKVLKIPFFISAPTNLAGVGDNITRLGELLGSADTARLKTRALSDGLEALLRAPQTHPVSVFLQVGHPAQYSLNRNNLLSDVIALCGGQNVFAAASASAPLISPESVLARMPQIILVGRPDAAAQPQQDQQARDYWKKMGAPAAQAGHVYMMNADVLFRPGPRLIEAASSICALLQQVRK
jgi:iron complex transport system substrate-binding protein/vitamin B12 transport system substrate-binding protein